MISYYLSDCCKDAASGQAFRGLHGGWAYYNENGERKSTLFNYCPFCGEKLAALGDPERQGTE